MTRTAVVLFNLGGPDKPESVQPFLFNLFSDPAIIGVPNPMRWLLAKFVSIRRAPVAREIYDHLGGGSPLLPLTEAQSAGLEEKLDGETRVFIAMRYWHPMSDETAAAVKAYDPDRIVLLPLYPQFSTTTTASSVEDWSRAAKAAGLAAETRVVCCYPDASDFIAAHVAATARGIDEAAATGRPRVLFSAHGLPKKVIDAGDPYAWQVERTAAAVAEGLTAAGKQFDPVVCYQSRVGPLEWIGPATEDEIERAGSDGVPLVVVPIAFVSEHSETLVELDIEYREVADEAGVPAYVRVPALGTADGFIETLATAVNDALERPAGTCSAAGARVCPASLGKCPMDN